MVPGHVEEAVAVHRDTDRVMCICSLTQVLSSLYLPTLLGQATFCQDDSGIGVIEGDILIPTVGRDGVSSEDNCVNLVPGPAFGNRNRSHLL